MGNPKGIQGPRDKPYRDALRMEIAAAGEDHKALRAIARAHLKKAQSGDIHAIRELADRMDGKVPQAIGSSDELGPLTHSITWLNPNQSPLTTGQDDTSSPSTTDPRDGPVS